MPNYIQNLVTIDGPPETLKALRERLRCGDREFSLHALIPMPDELREIIITSDRGGFKEWRAIPGTRGLCANDRVPVPDDELERMRMQHGATNWYDWATENWGTKWDTHYPGDTQASDTRLVYRFQTAWNPPEPIYNKLAAEYPECAITWQFDDEVVDPDDLRGSLGTEPE